MHWNAWWGKSFSVTRYWSVNLWPSVEFTWICGNQSFHVDTKWLLWEFKINTFWRNEEVATEPVPPDDGPDFSCQKCGKECDVAPQPPARAICEDCCEDHEYVYEQGERGHFCKHCNKPAPPDWFDD